MYTKIVKLRGSGFNASAFFIYENNVTDTSLPRIWAGVEHILQLHKGKGQACALSTPAGCHWRLADCVRTRSSRRLTRPDGSRYHR